MAEDMDPCGAAVAVAGRLRLNFMEDADRILAVPEGSAERSEVP